MFEPKRKWFYEIDWEDRTVLLKGILSIKEEDYGRFTELALGAGMVEALAEEVGDWTFPEEDGYGRYRDDMGRAVFDACAPVIGAGSVLVFMENWDEAEEKDPRIWRYTFDGEKMRVQDGRFVF